MLTTHAAEPDATARADPRRPRGPVVVGVEGATAGLAAARWAAREAELRGLPMEIVHGYEAARPPGAGEVFATAESLDAAGRYARRDTAERDDRRREERLPHDVVRQTAATVIAAARDAAHGAAPQVPVTATADPKPPHQALVDRSRQASLVVIGHRGHGVGSALRELRSPVASRVTAGALAPVTVVHAGTGDAPATGGLVVVGLDGSAGSRAALGFAFAEAALRHAALEVVRAVPLDAVAPGLDWDEVDQELCDWVEPWRETYRHLPVTYTVSPAQPMCALIDVSRHAALLVVGAQGERASGAIGRLGLVAQQLVHLAACPVTIIRPT